MELASRISSYGDDKLPSTDGTSPNANPTSDENSNSDDQTSSQNPTESKSVLNLIEQLKSMIYSNQVEEESPKSAQVSDAPQRTHPIRTYTPEYLIWCLGFEASNEPPEQMTRLMRKFPKIMKPFGNSGRVRLFPATYKIRNPRAAKPCPTAASSVPSSVLDSLPLLPTANVYKMDPETQLWEPRARPVEPKEKKIRRRKYRST